MDFNEYQNKASSTAVYPFSVEVVYPALGLANEAGEVAGKIKKILRGDGLTVATASNLPANQFFKELSTEKQLELVYEMGDVLWYLSALATDLGFSLEEIAQANIAKLFDRKERDVLKGNGDNR